MNRHTLGGYLEEIEMNQHTLERERALLKAALEGIAHRLPLTRRTYPPRYCRLLWHHLRGTQPDPADALNATLNHIIRQIHDFYGWMAKNSGGNRKNCAGTFYRTEGFIRIKPAERNGSRNGGNIHIEHTIPINDLLRAVKRYIKSDDDLTCADLHTFLIRHSICTAFS